MSVWFSLIGLEGRIVLRIQVDNSVHPVTAGFNAMLVSADEGAGAVFIVNEWIIDMRVAKWMV